MPANLGGVPLAPTTFAGPLGNAGVLPRCRFGEAALLGQQPASRFFVCWRCSGGNSLTCEYASGGDLQLGDGALGGHRVLGDGRVLGSPMFPPEYAGGRHDLLVLAEQPVRCR
ncbi:hypothetical protein PQR15_36720 [Streptomyces lydicus]|nr:hypothetical protein [Streptomyces lydicus]